MGDHIQKTRVVDGVEQLLWKKPIYSTINPEEIENYVETLDNTGDPWLEWIGTPQEGLAQSIFKTIKYAATGDMGKFKSNKLLQGRVMYGIADGLLMMLIFGIVAAMLKAWIADNGTDGVDGQTIAFVEQVNKRILSESNLYNNTFGALRTTPAFLSYGTKIVGDISDVFAGDKTMGDLAKNIKATELINLGE